MFPYSSSSAASVNPKGQIFWRRFLIPDGKMDPTELSALKKRSMRSEKVEPIEPSM